METNLLPQSVLYNHHQDKMNSKISNNDTQEIPTQISKLASPTPEFTLPNRPIYTRPQSQFFNNRKKTNLNKSQTNLLSQAYEGSSINQKPKKQYQASKKLLASDQCQTRSGSNSRAFTRIIQHKDDIYSPKSSVQDAYEQIIGSIKQPKLKKQQEVRSQTARRKPTERGFNDVQKPIQDNYLTGSASQRIDLGSKQSTVQELYVQKLNKILNSSSFISPKKLDTSERQQRRNISILDKPVYKLHETDLRMIIHNTTRQLSQTAYTDTQFDQNLTFSKIQQPQKPERMSFEPQHEKADFLRSKTTVNQLPKKKDHDNVKQRTKFVNMIGSQVESGSPEDRKEFLVENVQLIDQLKSRRSERIKKIRKAQQQLLDRQKQQGTTHSQFPGQNNFNTDSTFQDNQKASNQVDRIHRLSSKLKLAANLVNSNGQNPDLLKPKFVNCIAKLNQAKTQPDIHFIKPDVRTLRDANLSDNMLLIIAKISFQNVQDMTFGRIKEIHQETINEYSSILENQLEDEKFKLKTEQVQQNTTNQIKSDLKIQNRLEDEHFWLSKFNLLEKIKIFRPQDVPQSFVFDIQNMVQLVEEVQITAGERLLYPDGIFNDELVEKTYFEDSSYSFQFWKTRHPGRTITWQQFNNSYLSKEVMWNFALNTSRWLSKIRSKKSENEEWDYEGEPLSQIYQVQNPLLLFKPIEEIFIERDSKNRSQYYLQAKTRINNEIWNSVVEYELMTPQFKKVLAADYALMISHNQQFEFAEIVGITSKNKKQQIESIFEGMIEKLADHVAFTTNTLNATQPKKKIEKIPNRYLMRLMAKANESTVDSNFNIYIKNVFSFIPFYGLESALKPQDNNHNLVRDWNKSDFVKNLKEPQKFYKIFEVKSEPLFGGDSNAIEKLFQLNRIDWRTVGKNRIQDILESHKKRHCEIMILNQNEQWRYKQQLVPVDRTMYSDLYALSFYKTEFALENYTIYPRMEVVNVYNMFIERKFCHFFQEKSWFAISASEIYYQLYEQEMQRRKEEAERAADKEVMRLNFIQDERRASERFRMIADKKRQALIKEEELARVRKITENRIFNQKKISVIQEEEKLSDLTPYKQAEPNIDHDKKSHISQDSEQDENPGIKIFHPRLTLKLTQTERNPIDANDQPIDAGKDVEDSDSSQLIHDQITNLDNIVHIQSNVSSSCPSFTSDDSFSYETPSSKSDVEIKKNRRLPNALKPYFTKMFDSDEVKFMESQLYKDASFLEHQTNFNFWLDHPTIGPIEKIVDDEIFSDTSSQDSENSHVVSESTTPAQKSPVKFLYNDLEIWRKTRNIFTQQESSDDQLNQKLTAQLQEEYFNAVFRGDQEMCRQYIERFDISVNAQNELGETALSIASQQSQFQLIEMLLKMGADKTIKNKAGRLPSDYTVGH